MASRLNKVHIPIGTRGLTGNKNHARLSPLDLLEATNISLESGTVRKEPGSIKYNSTAISSGPTIQGGYDWVPASSTQRIIVLTSSGKLLKDTGDGAFSVTLKSGLTVSSVVGVFVEGGKEAAAGSEKLFIFTGKNAVQVLTADGTTTSDLSTPPADWSGSNQPIFGVNHEDRIWGGGNVNDPHRMYYSDTTNQENMTSGVSGTISIYPGEGEGLIGAISFKDLLICWKKPAGIYVINTTDTSVSKWTVSRVNKELGGISPLGAVIVENDVIFIDQTGSFHALSTVTEFGNLGARSLSTLHEMDDFVRENLNIAQLPKAQGIFYPAKNEAHFAVAAFGSTVNNARLIIDFNVPDDIRFTFSRKDIQESIWLRKDSDGIKRPTIGDNAGFVWTLDQDSRTTGSGYNGQFQIPYNDFADQNPNFGTMRKEGKFLEIIAEPTGDYNLSVDLYWDGSYTQTVQFNMGEQGATLGSFILGTDKLGGAQLVNKKKKITSGGRRLSLVGRNSGDGQDFSVSEFFLHFKPGSEEITE